MEALKEQLETLLAKMDGFFVSKNPRERLMLFVTPLLLFGFVAVEYLIPPLEAEHARISGELRSIQSEITSYKDLVSTKTDGSRHYLDRLLGENDRLRTQIAQVKDTALYAEARLQELDFIRFNASNWSDFLHQLITYSTQNRIEMSAFSNNRTHGENDPVHLRRVLSVDFNTTGTFYNMIAFIKAIESDRAMSEIERLTLRGRNGAVSADFTLSLWGIQE